MFFTILFYVHIYIRCHLQDKYKSEEPPVELAPRKRKDLKQRKKKSMIEFESGFVQKDDSTTIEDQFKHSMILQCGRP